MKKWEYYVESFAGTVDAHKLDLLGASGWELVSTASYGEPNKPVLIIFTFKRELVVKTNV